MFVTCIHQDLTISHLHWVDCLYQAFEKQRRVFHTHKHKVTHTHTNLYYLFDVNVHMNRAETPDDGFYACMDVMLCGHFATIIPLPHFYRYFLTHPF